MSEVVAALLAEVSEAPWWRALTADLVVGLGFLLVLRWMLEHHTRKLDAVEHAIRASTLIQLDMHKTLIMHDAQVRGVNPSAGVDQTDAHQKAHDEYIKVLNAIDSTSEAIKAAVTFEPGVSKIKLPL